MDTEGELGWKRGEALKRSWNFEREVAELAANSDLLPALLILSLSVKLRPINIRRSFSRANFNSLSLSLSLSFAP